MLNIAYYAFAYMLWTFVILVSCVSIQLVLGVAVPLLSCPRDCIPCSFICLLSAEVSVSVHWFSSFPQANAKIGTGCASLVMECACTWWNLPFLISCCLHKVICLLSTCLPQLCSRVYWCWPVFILLFSPHAFTTSRYCSSFYYFFPFFSSL